MTRLVVILSIVLAILIAPPAYAGAKKTADALYATLDQIEAAKISNPCAALQNNIKEAASLIGGY